MPQKIFRTPRVLVIFISVLVFCGNAFAQHESTLYKFQGQIGNRYDGASPEASLTMGPDGTLYGTSLYGGTAATCEDQDGFTYTCGTVFQLKPPSAGGLPWTESVIQSFGVQGSAGYWPTSGLILDRAGNLYGTNYNGGVSTCGYLIYYFCGTVFELVRPQEGGDPWAWNIIYEFQPGDDANSPFSRLVFDGKGNLYGTTVYGGAQDAGTVYRLAPPAPGSETWTETVLYSFCSQTGCQDGYFPISSLVLDAKGNLFSTTPFGGTGSCEGSERGCGTVFELSPPQVNGNPWTETVIYSFQGGSDGIGPNGIIFGRDGSLYGTTEAGGGNACDNGLPTTCGTVFKLSPPASNGGPWTETVLYKFNGTDGGLPVGSLVADAAGRLYGATQFGGGIDNCSSSGASCGTVFELTQESGAWSERVLYRFGASVISDGRTIPGGYWPEAGLTIGRDGQLFGTASAGGQPTCQGGESTFPCGTVFEITK